MIDVSNKPNGFYWALYNAKAFGEWLVIEILSGEIYITGTEISFSPKDFDAISHEKLEPPNGSD